MTELHHGASFSFSSFIGRVYYPIPYIVRVFTKFVSCIPIFLSPLTCVYLTDVILVSSIAERECCICCMVVLC